MKHSLFIALILTVVTVLSAQSNYEIMLSRPDIDGLTGGGATDLDGIPTTGLAVGTIIIVYDGSETRIYRLTAGTDAENSPTVIRPDDFADPGNAKVWKTSISSDPDETGYSGGWALTGNTGAGNFLGSTDAQPLSIRTNNTEKTRITTKGQIETYNTGYSVFVGEGAGATDDLSDNKNVFAGYQAGNVNVGGSFNVAVGSEALLANTDGNYNIAGGYEALNKNTTGAMNIGQGWRALYNNTDGTGNIAIGNAALFNNVANSRSTAIGHSALFYADNRAVGRETFNTAVGWNALAGTSTPANNTGQYNTAIGDMAMYSNSNGYDNIGIGVSALYSNHQGYHNTAVGNEALYSNLWGFDNTAVGYNALYSDTSGQYNTAVGAFALQANIGAVYNTAIGHEALVAHYKGSSNTAIGTRSLYSDTVSGYNTALGAYALYNCVGERNSAGGYMAMMNNTTGYRNTGFGGYALSINTTGYGNTALGYDASVSSGNLHNATAIGYASRVSTNNTVTIGNINVLTANVNVDWTITSDGRFKRDIHEDVHGLDFITKLRPITYHWDMHKMGDEVYGRGNDTTMWEGKYDIERVKWTGFIAQEVERAAKECGYDFSGVDNGGKIMGLRYAQFVVPLVKAVQEQQEQIERQGDEIERLKAENQKMKRAFERLGIVIE